MEKVKTINTLYKAHPFLETKVEVSFDRIDKIERIRKLSAVRVREHVAYVCNTISEIYYLGGVEGWKKSEVVAVIDDVYGEKMTKQERSKAVKFANYAYDCQAYLLAIGSKAVSIDRMVRVFDAYLKTLEPKKVENSGNTIEIGGFSYGVTMSDSMPSIAETVGTGTILKTDPNVSEVKSDSGIHTELKPLTKSDALLRIGGGVKAFFDFANDFSVSEINKIASAYKEALILCEELLKVRKVA